MRECRRAIDSREYALWRAYDRMSPIGAERGDIHAATVAAAVFNARRRKSSDRWIQPAALMPKFYQPRRRQTPAQMFETVKALNAAWGGTFVGKA